MLSVQIVSPKRMPHARSFDGGLAAGQEVSHIWAISPQGLNLYDPSDAMLRQSPTVIGAPGIQRAGTAKIHETTTPPGPLSKSSQDTKKGEDGPAVKTIKRPKGDVVCNA